MSKAVTIIGVLVAAGYAVVLATGLFAIGFAVTAAVKGYTPGDFYAEMFPVYRGPGEAPISPMVYAIFVAYVIAAAQISIACRRRIAQRWFGK
jgi:hypothetical protein